MKIYIVSTLLLMIACDGSRFSRSATGASENKMADSTALPLPVSQAEAAMDRPNGDDGTLIRDEEIASEPVPVGGYYLVCRPQSVMNAQGSQTVLCGLRVVEPASLPLNYIAKFNVEGVEVQAQITNVPLEWQLEIPSQLVKAEMAIHLDIIDLDSTKVQGVDTSVKLNLYNFAFNPFVFVGDGNINLANNPDCPELSKAKPVASLTYQLMVAEPDTEITILVDSMCGISNETRELNKINIDAPDFEKSLTIPPGSSRFVVMEKMRVQPGVLSFTFVPQRTIANSNDLDDFLIKQVRVHSSKSVTLQTPK